MRNFVKVAMLQYESMGIYGLRCINLASKVVFASIAPERRGRDLDRATGRIRRVWRTELHVAEICIGGVIVGMFHASINDGVATIATFTQFRQFTGLGLSAISP